MRVFYLFFNITTMEDTEIIKYMMFGFALIVVLGICMIMLTIEIEDLKNNIYEFKENSREEYYRGVAGTGSMEPLINKRVYPNLLTYNRLLNATEELHLERMYIYEYQESGNITYVLHRLVGILNVSNITVYVFMGDNNKVIDDRIITRDQIQEEVVGIKYE